MSTKFTAAAGHASRAVLLLGSCLTGGAFLFSVPTASAQQNAAAASSSSMPEEIVVTARRREEKLQSVPIAVTALTGAQLREQHIVETQDLQFSTPSLQLQPGLNGNQSASFTIRGLGQPQGINQPSVITYFEDVPLDPNGGAAFTLYDLESTQVLRGPQGTLFGRNTNGGAVLMTPVAPGDTFKGIVDASFGNLGLVDVKAGVTVPVTDKLSIRVSGDILRRDGYTKNLSGPDLNDENSNSWRVFIRFRPTDWLQNDTVYNGLSAHEHGSANILSDVTPGGFSDLVYPSIVAALAAQRGYGPWVINENEPMNSHRDIHLVANTTTIDLNDEISLKNIFGYEGLQVSYATDLDGSTVPLLFSTSNPDSRALLPLHPDTDLNQFTDELQLAGKSFDEKLNWIIGGFYLNSANPNGLNGFFENRYAFAFAQNQSSFTTDDTSKAIFAQGTYDLGDLVEGLKFTAGGRYTWDDRAASTGEYTSRTFPPLHAPASSYFCATPPLAPTTPIAQCYIVERASFANYGYNFDVDWQATPDVLLYATTRRGYKSGGFNGVNGSNNPSYQPEVLTDVEAGVKTDWSFGGVRGRLNADYFHGWYDNVQEQVVIPGPTPTTAITNAATATTDGFELEGSVFLTKQLEVSAFYSWLRGRYQKFSDGGQDVSGSPFVGMPKNSGNITVTYTQPLQGDLGTLVGSLQGYAQTTVAFNSDTVQNPDAFAPGYAILNARLDWRDVAGYPLDISLFGRNITNKAYVQGGISLQKAIGESSQLYGAPATYGVELVYHFGDAKPEPVAEAPYAPPPAVAVAPSVPKSYLVFFDFNKSDLTPQAVTIVDEAAKNAGPAKVTQLTVTGHTDTVGSDAYNMRLSRRRAESVAAQLEKDGIPSSEIEIVAKGKRDLLVPTKDGVREPQNRRVQIVYDNGMTS